MCPFGKKERDYVRKIGGACTVGYGEKRVAERKMRINYMNKL